METQTTVQLTELEKEVLLAVYWSDYQEGCEGEEKVNNPVWYLDENDVDMKPGQLSGAVSSCSKKGFVGLMIDKKNRTESTIWLTQEGYNRIKGLV